MIRMSPDSVLSGDTARISWEIPSGSRVLHGPQENDSLVVRPDTARPGQWIVQPLSLARFGGDTLSAVSPSGDTLREVVPAWQARPRLKGTDSAVAALLPPQKVPVPFPWDLVGFGALGAGLAVLAVWGWLRWKKWKASRVPPPPPPPPRDPVEVCRERLDELVRGSLAGVPPRETAFAAGELLRGLHASLHGWAVSVESTSREWKLWARSRRPEGERFALDAFLAEADALRYADATSDAQALLAQARVLLEEIARRRAEAP